MVRAKSKGDGSELKRRHFWATDGNWKWGLFHFSMPCANKFVSLSSAGSRPCDKGGGTVIQSLRYVGRLVSKKIFLSLRAPVWFKNKGGGTPLPPGPLPWIRHCLVSLPPLYWRFARKFGQNVENLLAVIVRRSKTPLLKFPNTYVSTYLLKQASTDSQLLHLVPKESWNEVPTCHPQNVQSSVLGYGTDAVGRAESLFKIGVLLTENATNIVH